MPADALLAILNQLEMRHNIAYLARMMALLMNLKIITVAPKPVIVLNARQKALNAIYVQLDTSLMTIVPLQQHLVFLVPTPAQIANQVQSAILVLKQ
ncbi:unnamed protein product [Blepharisma stoltei]|uniref:Uncharacterized protein n=1 Tax=Blepharisma stoltei TaxID=1481888 RepID=A0AAU9K9G4_9CILI|nr:unnamed protein product [Blepharisma stoltei]